MTVYGFIIMMVILSPVWALIAYDIWEGITK
jgi:hypothetical protein